MKLDEAIQKAREKLQDPAAKAVVQGEMHYMGIPTEDEVKPQASPGNTSNGNRALEGKAVVAFRLYVRAVMDRTRAKPEVAFEVAKVIVFEAFQDTRDNKEFTKCLREVLGQAVEAK
jgi:hypothetical protein